jgi:hypothetical protein
VSDLPLGPEPKKVHSDYNPAMRQQSQPRLSPSQELLRYFKHDHLPDPLRQISMVCANVAGQMEEWLPDGPEKTMGLRKLLEAKDCFVRAALPRPPAEAYIGVQESKTHPSWTPGVGE